MKKIKFLMLIGLVLSVVWLLLFPGASEYEANLDFVFSCADENAQIENERMSRQIEDSLRRFLTKTSLQRTSVRFCENYIEYSALREIVSNVVFECAINCIDKECHRYRLKLIAPSRMLAEKMVKFVFASCQKTMKDRQEIVFQKNAGRVEDLHKLEILRKKINMDSLKMEIYGDVRIRRKRWFDVLIKLFFEE